MKKNACSPKSVSTFGSSTIEIVHQLPQLGLILI